MNQNDYMNSGCNNGCDNNCNDNCCNNSCNNNCNNNCCDNNCNNNCNNCCYKENCCDNRLSDLCCCNPCCTTYYIASISCYLFKCLGPNDLDVVAAIFTALADNIYLMLAQYNACCPEEDEDFAKPDTGDTSDTSGTSGSSSESNHSGSGSAVETGNDICPDAFLSATSAPNASDAYSASGASDAFSN